MSGAVEINCYIPITVRIVGVPSDDQLAAIGRSLTRLVAARLAEAQRLVAHRHGGTRDPSTVVRGRWLAAGPAGTVAGVRFTPASWPAAADPEPFVPDPASSEPGLLDGSLAQPLTVDLEPLRRQAAHDADEDSARALDAALAKHLATGEGIGGRDGRRTPAMRNGQRSFAPVDRPLDLTGGEHLEADVETHLGLRPTKPGDLAQQQYAIPPVDANIWYRFSNLHAEFERVARRAAQNPNPKRNFTYWLARFRDEFVGSLGYILEHRETRTYRAAGKGFGIDVRGLILHDLRLAEEAAIKDNQQLGPYGSPVALVEKIEGLRRTAKQRWDKEIDDAAARFMVLARNQAEFEAFRQVGVQPFKIAGLPADVEPVVPATIDKDLFEQEKNSPGFAESMVKIMKAIQANYHNRKVKAGNYHGHAEANPSFGGPGNAGMYSVDINISQWAPVNAEGFYDRAGAVEFFLAVEKAANSKDGDFAWLAFYNDFAVAEEVNRQTHKFRILFSGAGGPPNPTPEQKNSYHHGPAPYILHIHMNFMPNKLAAQYLAGKNSDDLQYYDFSGANQ